MPNVLVLFDGTDDASVDLAEHAAKGASSVRFMEVTVRAVGARGATPRTVLESPDVIEQYDGVVIATTDRPISHAIEQTLAALDASRSGTFSNTVFAVTALENQALLSHVAQLGGLLVTTRSRGGDASHAAWHLGERVASVVGWVRHALSHEHGHGSHSEGHRHAHERLS